MQHAIDILTERGFIEATTHDEELRNWLATPGQHCYIGFDPTAASLHVGSLVPIMALAWMQRLGHRPIGLVGGGTGLVGDPSGKTEMRQFLTLEEVTVNAQAIKEQLARFIDFSEDRALMVNNADWLTRLEYIPFLRDIGRHFSVNRMIKAESCKLRLDSEEGLSFIEFNYMLLQAYDFLQLFNDQGCRLQMGGSDQWGNIVAGIDLIRRVRQEPAFGMTFPLITTSTGAKMGKTAAGAVWLDPARTSPYAYYQFWINTEDRDVARFLALFTYLPMAEIRDVESLTDADINLAKSILAFEATRIAHGENEARAAAAAAAQVFGSRRIPDGLLPSSTISRGGPDDQSDAVPQTAVSAQDMAFGIPAFKLFQLSGLTDSGSAARRLIAQGGAYINGTRIDSGDTVIQADQFVDGELLLRAGKKRFHKIKIA